MPAAVLIIGFSGDNDNLIDVIFGINQNDSN
jgi:hypothetical protein